MRLRRENTRSEHRNLTKKYEMELTSDIAVPSLSPATLSVPFEAADNSAAETLRAAYRRKQRLVEYTYTVKQ